MPKFLIEASYTAEGLKGLQQDKASGRHAALKQAAESVGGRVESMHFALGKEDVVVILDLPDAGAAAAVALAGSTAGLVQTHTTALLTVAEMDEALGRRVAFRLPGQ